MTSLRTRFRLRRGIAAMAVATTGLAVAPSAGTVSAATCSAANVVQTGSNNDEVRRVETRLAELGFFGAPADNAFDETTAAAVRAFQTVRGLYPDGTVHTLTARQLGLCGNGNPLANPIRVTVMGDSTVAAVRWYDEAQRVSTRYDILGDTYDTILSVESCRRLVAVSCVGRTDPSTGFKWRPESVLPLMQGSLRGKLGDAVVIVAGYDDTTIVSAIDQIMAEASAQGVQRVFWLNYRTSTTYGYGPYYAAHNNALNAAQPRYPNLTVLDWNGYTRSQSSATQVAWFAPDDIHLDPLGASAMAQYIKGAIDASDLNPAVRVPFTPAPIEAAGQAGLLNVITPTRVLDTRQGTRFRAGEFRQIALPAAPAGSTAVAVNVTAVRPSARGFVTMYPCDLPRPEVSMLNYQSGAVIGASAIVAVSGDRQLCVYSNAAADIVLDLTAGFVPGNGMGYTATAPTRLLDTRNGAGTPVAGKTEVKINVGGAGALVNIAATGATASGWVTAHACGSALPTVSNLNYTAGRARSNQAVIAADGNGDVCLYASTTVHVIVDLVGRFAPGGGQAFQPARPTRVLDTRSGVGGWRNRVAGSQTVTAPTAGLSGKTVVGTLVAVDAPGSGWATAWNGQPPQPVVANMNYAAGDVLASSIASAADNAEITINVGPGSPGHLVFDVTGWFTS